MKLPGGLSVAGLAMFALTQLVRPGIASRPATAEVHSSADVKRIAQRGLQHNGPASCSVSLRRGCPRPVVGRLEI